MAKPPAKIYQIKVAPKDIRPPIWRRIRVAGSTSLLKLHDILQVVLGWHDAHLHQFEIDGMAYVEKIMLPAPGERYPLCLAGKRACPPEDCGGVWGYHEFLQAIANPKHPEHDVLLQWAGGEFDPEAFDVDDVNAQLRGMGRGRSAGAADPWTLDESAAAGNAAGLESAWARAVSAGE